MVDSTQLAPMLTGVVSSSVTMFVVSLATQKISPVPEHIQDAMQVTTTVGPIPKRFLSATEFGLTQEAAAISKVLEGDSQDG